MTGRRRGLAAWALAGVLGLSGTLQAAGRRYVLVDEGEPVWAVYSPKDATAGEALAAREFVRYVKEMSGAELTVTHDWGGGNVVAVANDAHLPAIPDNFVTLRGADEYNVVGAKNVICVSGHGDGATLHATYKFLDALGCRFLAPKFGHYQGSAEIVPKSRTVAFDESVFAGQQTPALKLRKLYVEEGHSHNAENLAQMAEWMPKVGYNTLVVPTNYQGHDRVKWDNWRVALTPELQKRGITIEVGGHGYQNFLNAGMEGGTLLQKHPEYFGQDAQGKRRSDDHSVFCTSNPDAVAYLTARFVEYVKARPEIQIYDFWPPDGAKWCECEKCKSLGSPSDRQAILLKQVREAVAKDRPDLRLEMIAYSSYVTPPEHQAVDPSVLVDFCPINQSFAYQINDPASDRNAEYVRNLTAWRGKFAGDISIYSYYRKYAWDSMPVLIPHFMQRDLKWYATLPTQGVSTYAEPGDWFTYELNHYVLAALAWDPDADVDRLVRRFAEARYGPAADAAVQAYGVLEDVVRTTCSIPFTPRRGHDELIGTLRRLVGAKDLLKAARGDVRDEAVLRNLGRLTLAIDYAIGDVKVLESVGRKDLAEARRVADETVAMIRAHEEDGVFISRSGRLTPSRLLTRAGVSAKSAAAAQ